MFGSITLEMLNSAGRYFSNIPLPTKEPLKSGYEIHPDDLEKLASTKAVGYVRVKPIEVAE